MVPWAYDGRIDIASTSDARMRRIIEHLLIAAMTPDNNSLILTLTKRPAASFVEPIKRVRRVHNLQARETRKHVARATRFASAVMMAASVLAWLVTGLE
jgi:hypothetical protein